MHAGFTSGGSTEPCLHLSCRVYRFCSSAISVMFLSWRLIPRLWQLWLSFRCWFQWYFRTFSSCNMVQFWDLILKLPVRPVFILLQICNRGGTWQKRSFSTYMTVVRKIVHVNRDRVVRARRFLLLYPGCLQVTSGKWRQLRESHREWQLPHMQEMVWGEEE